MTKKHYKILAEAIRKATDTNGAIIHKDQLISELVQRLKEDNPNFDGFRFIEACQ